ncbi:unnamed protein product [Zymoseptoria tritici ST99CH_3D1]|uniref:DNA-directed RNA polymerase subunit n=2 Tax=Zymoseptoria tritici TaxID=1047171 RepID=A0A1X7RE09_ZYMT9|nr:unnamed protein product [Zymoseptoria tritici ST99CH_3D7]SMR41604.1 unnamed protein product [Zymoseptoria tritici ST99CH_1E4]SMR43793.1 unnamed protein product [Zymoseptoria tritici ST99CH_3D1]
MDNTASTDDFTSKEQVIDQVPKRIKSLQFGLLSPSDIIAQSVVPVADRNLYDLATQPGAGRSITKHGPLDQRLGTSSKNGLCGTCGQGLKECNGHFGHVKLALPCFHYGYIKKVIDALNCVCKECSRVLLPEKDKRAYLKSLRRPGLDGLRKEVLTKKISAECRKVKVCPHCSAFNGPVRKVPGHPVKMFHNKYAIYTNSNAKSKVKPAHMQAFEATFEEAIKANPEIERHMKRAADDLTPLRVLNILKKVPNADVELLGMDPHSGGRPEYMIWTSIPAPPVAIRPSVAQETASTEDDITNKLGDIIQINSLMIATLRAGQQLSKVMDMWEFLQVQIAMYIDGNIPGLARDSSYGKAMRGFCQRLKGKQGRFRGNLSGKRVDFSGRTVISPDPNLSIDEVAVPMRVAVNMTYPERVTKHNFEKLKACVRRGDKVHPGANFIVKGRDGRRVVLRMVGLKGDLKKVADQLEIGDTVERHLEDGDIVLFNRQPSLHKLSILSHRAKIRPWRTFRLNECVCNPYNADFDGDEMNLHVPQTEEARTEATELMGVKHNLATPKNGTPIIAAIQDFITGAFLISRKDQFFNRRQFNQAVTFMYDGLQVKDPLTGETHNIEIPAPAIWKPQTLWTGKQIWDVLMKPHRHYPVNVNLEAKLKSFAPPKRKGDIDDMVDSDSYLVIRNSVTMCGGFDKATVGDGKKTSVFYVIMRDFGVDYAAAAMTRLAKLSARWLGEQGFSIGISDVYPSDKLNLRKKELVDAAYRQCDEIIDKFKKGQLERSAGCDEEQTMEILMSGILSAVRQQCGDACFAELSKFNAPLTMAKCGSKGSNINVSQMVAAVGQQIIGGKRVLDGFQDRTLPHFPKASRDPLAKGFVVDSFFSGLSPTEFIFHAMSGREGLVDTAVKTAETGYMSRRLMKSLEDLSAQYDLTVRNSSSGVVQMKFGDDGLDPVDMEGNAKPVNFDRTWMHAITSTWDNSERGLTQNEIEEMVHETLDKERAKLVRITDDGLPLPYEDATPKSTDQLEYSRTFLDDVTNYIFKHVRKLVSSQHRHRGSDDVFKLSQSALECFLYLCLRKFEKSKVEAGHAVGAVGAQSIGEPGTQMTLKTFHFAGVAGMSITQGVPRIKEIINASKSISTPVITCALDSPYEEMAGRFAKALIEKTYLGDIVDYIEDVWHAHGCYINMRVNWEQVENLGLRITMWHITEAINRSKGFKSMGVSASASESHIRVRLTLPDSSKLRKAAATKHLRFSDNDDSEVLFMQIHTLKRKLPAVVVKGYPDAARAIMKKDDKADASGREPISVLVEGYGLKACMTTDGVDGYRTKSNNVMECKDVLGIEAARKTIIDEISAVMGGMDIDPRHMQLLADVMTYKGEVLGITRFGLAKMRDSVLQLASFEKTPDHLFEAAAKMKKDDIEGVSECIIMGQVMGVGTGAMKVVRPLHLTGEVNHVGNITFKGEVKAGLAARKERARERREKLLGREGVNGHAAPVAVGA